MVRSTCMMAKVQLTTKLSSLGRKYRWSELCEPCLLHYYYSYHFHHMQFKHVLKDLQDLRQASEVKEKALEEMEKLEKVRPNFKHVFCYAYFIISYLAHLNNMQRSATSSPIKSKLLTKSRKDCKSRKGKRMS